MIVDTSALVAVVKGEPEAVIYLTRLLDEPVKISAVTAFEFGMVVDGWKDEQSSKDADLLLLSIDAEIVAVDAETAQAARAAYRQFGKGNHPARLNFGDCFAYALARETGEPLLFKGDDFARTDVRSAV
ncbi:MAG: type II toxin-antitoxin system VapC family toxin [Brevundimonas sp.]|uniref:type II toxin-antitoxin system VapC family toxin n=1 Tax=Brevundimonas sp. TaxID=1871086 RepID=UPI002732F428|nr:type II toxin-antitoxin system VapC family toxin [Brevundimonas sp.]MDP3376989.1 type II toxin-antitoxin system VapC family toxin [Brevundimonas sp.]